MEVDTPALETPSQGSSTGRPEGGSVTPTNVPDDEVLEAPGVTLPDAPELEGEDPPFFSGSSPNPLREY